MKCILCKHLRGDIDSVITQCDDWPKPKRTVGKGDLLVRVLACSLAPGDIRVLTGQCDFYQSPKQFPYIPGGDLCGIVEEADEDSKFKVGDCVAVLFEIPRPLGGLAEYAVVKSALAEVKPKSVSPMEAACLPSSAITAMFATQRHVKKGDRVLVLGGSGGVGTSFVQLAKHAGASFIAATSTQEELLQSLGVDKVINYNDQDWWDVNAFKEEPFDLIFDLVGGKMAWDKAKSTGVLKRRGIFLVTIGDEALPEIHGWLDLVKFQLPAMWRSLWTYLYPFVPMYKYHYGLDIKPGSLGELFQMVDDGHLKVVVDPSSPFPFNTEGAKKALWLQKSRHAHGKVVINVA